MHTGSLLFVDVGNFVEATVAYEAPMWQRQIRFLADNCRLHFHYLGHVIGARFEFVGFHTFVDAN